jgi:hypothetical protein
MDTQRNLWRKLKYVAVRAFAVVGIAATGSFAGGLASDLRAFDRTRGGYELPYTGYTGTPTDWSVADNTRSGMAYRGRILNVLVDCTTGMISFQWFGLEKPFRKFSPRALVVHKPREACRERGFEPQF